ncbi:TRADD-N-associated membrane domain-containing protein [Microbacterium sp. A93]|uniref:TRADD-N-associated membrane domain-containing protein n=1 Tax=Microbacterium sp. A93 TaxID=3450716 RepID=UPI003F4214DD
MITGAIAGATLFIPPIFATTSDSLGTWDLSDVPVGFWLGLSGVVLFGVLAVLLQQSLAARRSAAAQEKAEWALQGLKDSDDLLGLIKANASQMHAYDLMARRQAAQSHRASMIAMFVGLALVAAGVAVAIMAPDAVSKITGASVTSIGAVVGGYVARTFMANGRRSSENAAFYFQQPLVTSYLLTAERLISQLPEQERPQALSTTIDTVLRQASAAAGGSGTADVENISGRPLSD